VAIAAVYRVAAGPRASCAAMSQERDDTPDRGGERCSWPRRRSRISTASCKSSQPKGAEKRKQHGSKGSTVFRDPNEDDRVWVLFDWDEEGFQNFLSDPEVPAIIQEAAHKRRPQPAELGGQYDA
jgi:hypothetical protein